MVAKTLIFVASLSVALSSLLHSEDDEKKIIREKMIPCTVKIMCQGSVGGGVIIYSKNTGPRGIAETYIWTDYHVVEDSADVKTDPEGKKTIKILPATVEIFEFKNRNLVIKETLLAYTLYYSKSGDLAILKLQSDHIFPAAEFADLNELNVFDDCYAVGCPAAENPTVTKGMIQQLDQKVKGINCWRISANIFFGNSGGGCWTKDGKLVGLVDMIRVHQNQGITFIGFIIPASNLSNWLVETNKQLADRLGHIIPLHERNKK